MAARWALTRHVSWLACCLIAASGVVVIAICATIYVATMNAPVAPDARLAFSQAEFVTIILTALTAVLACLGIVMTLAGAVGYVAIRRAVDVAALDAINKILPRTLKAMQDSSSVPNLDTEDEFARAAAREDYENG